MKKYLVTITNDKNEINIYSECFDLEKAKEIKRSLVSDECRADIMVVVESEENSEEKEYHIESRIKLENTGWRKHSDFDIVAKNKREAKEKAFEFTVVHIEELYDVKILKIDYNSLEVTYKECGIKYIIKF